MPHMAVREGSRKPANWTSDWRKCARSHLTHPQGGNWVPGDAPFAALEWAVSALAKAGELAIIGVYPETAKRFPIGKAMMKNLTLRMGNCNHRKYAPKLIELVRAGAVDPTRIRARQNHSRMQLTPTGASTSGGPDG